MTERDIDDTMTIRIKPSTYRAAIAALKHARGCTCDPAYKEAEEDMQQAAAIKRRTLGD